MSSSSEGSVPNAEARFPSNSPPQVATSSSAGAPLVAPSTEDVASQVARERLQWQQRDADRQRQLDALEVEVRDLRIRLQAERALRESIEKELQWRVSEAGPRCRCCPATAANPLGTGEPPHARLRQLQECLLGRPFKSPAETELEALLLELKPKPPIFDDDAKLRAMLQESEAKVEQFGRHCSDPLRGRRLAGNPLPPRPLPTWPG
eukprot:GGOE01045273.1.p1 GENE.GGOE01045273.1~~GGOE01045273.1.p1  ORF type:complete len:207 (-),score=41.14 GGOE01045273.1:153-773(-)